MEAEDQILPISKQMSQKILAKSVEHIIIIIIIIIIILFKIIHSLK